MRSAGTREFSDFSQAELEEYHDFRNGIGLESELPAESNRLWFTEGIDFSTARSAVLGPLVRTAPTPSLTDPTIVDADMELGSAAWVGEDSFSTSYNHTPGGAQSLRIDVNYDNSRTAYQDLSGYCPGATYQFTCWVYRISGAGTSSTKVGINDGVTETYGTPTSINSSWVQLTITKTISPEATQL